MNTFRLVYGLIRGLQDAPPALRLRILGCGLAVVAFLTVLGILAGMIYWHGSAGALP